MEKKERQKTEIGKLSETARRFNEVTLGALLPFWADNLAQNMPMILSGKNVEEISKRKGEPALIVAAGPSLKKKNHVRFIKNSAWAKKHPIITCDRLLIKLMSKGIVPYCVCTVDASPNVATFYRHNFIQSEYEEVHPVISVFAHPQVVNELNLDGKQIYWFIPFMDDAKNDPTSLTRMIHFMTNKSMLMVGGNVGTLSWNVAMYLGCNPIIMVGFDLSYDDPNITKSIYYKAFLGRLDGDVKKTKKLYAMAKHPVYGNKYVLDPIFKSYREMFRNYVATAHRLYGIETINATEGGAVFGRGIECTTLKEALRRYD